MLVLPAPWAPAGALVAAGLMVSLVPSRWVRGGWWPFAVSAAIVAGISAAAVVVPPSGAGLAPLAPGVVLGAPFLAAAWAVRWRASLAASLVNLPLAFVAAALSLAVSRSVVHPASPASWWLALSGTVTAQASAISGAGSAAPPLGYVGDLAFDALLLVGLGVLLLSMLHLPARMVALDATRVAPRAAEGPARPSGAPAEGSDIPASAYLAGGIVSLVVSLGALLAFLWGTMVSLPSALLALAVGVALAVVGGGWLVVHSPAQVGDAPPLRTPSSARRAPHPAMPDPER